MKQTWHPVIVVLHWMVAVLILCELAHGFAGLTLRANADPAKLGALMWHMSLGMVIFGLMLLRALTRGLTSHKPPQTGRSYWSFYGFVLVLTMSGMTLAVTAGLNRSVFMKTGEPLPVSFWSDPMGWLHLAASLSMAAVVAWHIGGKLYKHFGKKTGELKRMSFHA